MVGGDWEQRRADCSVAWLSWAVCPLASLVCRERLITSPFPPGWFQSACWVMRGNRPICFRSLAWQIWTKQRQVDSATCEIDIKLVHKKLRYVVFERLNIHLPCHTSNARNFWWLLRTLKVYQVYVNIRDPQGMCMIPQNFLYQRLL